jgi:hypothetical protein
MSWREWVQVRNFADLSPALIYPQRLLNLKSKTGLHNLIFKTVEQSKDASNPNDGSTIQENYFVLSGTLKNSAADGSVLDYWPLQAEWPSQQDEIALGSNMWRLSSRSLAQKRQKVFGKPILDKAKISELLATDILKFAMLSKRFSTDP